MADKTKDNPSGSPLKDYSLLNVVIKGVDKLTGYKRYFEKDKPYQKPRKVQGLDGTT